MTSESPPPRPFSPFMRLLIGAGTTALLGEWARFQADLTWAALPLGAGSVITLANVARGVRDRRRWRHAQAARAAAEASTQAAERDPNEGLPLPIGPAPSPLEATPDTVVARRDDRPAAPSTPAVERATPSERRAAASATDARRSDDAKPPSKRRADSSHGTGPRRESPVLDGAEND